MLHILIDTLIMAALPVNESKMPMLSQHQLNEDEEDIPLHDNESDITRVGTVAPYGKGHLRGRSPSDTSSWSYDSTNPTRTKRRRLRLQIMTWIRWSTIMFMQTFIVVLLLQRNSQERVLEETGVLRGKTVETGDDINEIYKTCKCPLSLQVLASSKLMSSIC